jgi:hypothetical protein
MSVAELDAPASLRKNIKSDKEPGIRARLFFTASVVSSGFLIEIESTPRVTIEA